VSDLCEISLVLQGASFDFCDSQLEAVAEALDLRLGGRQRCIFIAQELLILLKPTARVEEAVLSLSHHFLKIKELIGIQCFSVSLGFTCNDQASMGYMKTGHSRRASSEFFNLSRTLRI
jgi:hypothetical protein